MATSILIIAFFLWVIFSGEGRRPPTAPPTNQRKPDPPPAPPHRCKGTNCFHRSHVPHLSDQEYADWLRKQQEWVRGPLGERG